MSKSNRLSKLEAQYKALIDFKMCIREFESCHCATELELLRLEDVKPDFSHLLSFTENLTERQLCTRATIRAKYSLDNQPPRILLECYQ